MVYTRPERGESEQASCGEGKREREPQISRFMAVMGLRIVYATAVGFDWLSNYCHHVPARSWIPPVPNWHPFVGRGRDSTPVRRSAATVHLAWRASSSICQIERGGPSKSLENPPSNFHPSLAPSIFLPKPVLRP